MGALILDRRLKQVTRFFIGGRCIGTETVHEVNGQRVKVAYDFDRDVRIVREEVENGDCEGK